MAALRDDAQVVAKVQFIDGAGRRASSSAVSWRHRIFGPYRRHRYGRFLEKPFRNGNGVARFHVVSEADLDVLPIAVDDADDANSIERAVRRDAAGERQR